MDHTITSKEIKFLRDNDIHINVYLDFKELLINKLKKNPSITELKNNIRYLKRHRTICFRYASWNSSDEVTRCNFEYEVILTNYLIVFLEIYKTSLELKGDELLNYYNSYSFELGLVQNLLPPDEEINIEEFLEES